MRILQLVHDYLPEHAGGVEVHAHAIGRELARRGHRVTALFCERDLDREPGTLRSGELDGVRTLELVHQLEYGDVSETWLQPMARAAFERVLAAEQPQVVHVHHLGPFGPGVLSSARAAGCRVLFTAHDLHALCDDGRLMRPDGSRCDDPSRCVECLRRHPAAQRGTLEQAAELRRLAFAEGLLGVDCLIAPSRYVAGELGRLGLPAERFESLAPGVDGVCFEPRPRREGPLRLGFVGGLYPAKGAHVLLAALGRMARERPELAARVSLTLHGVLDWFPDYVDSLRAQARDAMELQRASGQPELRIRFAGRFAPAEVDRVYGALDALAVPSLWRENAPLVVQDARRHRLPVIGSNHGGLAEMVTDGVDGLLFTPADAGDLARAIARLIEQPELAQRLGAAGARPLSTAQVVDRLELLYGRIGR